MPENVEIKSSFLETEIEFETPNLKIWLDRIAMIEAVYTALRPWNITVDDIELIQNGKPSEQGVKFKIPEKRASFFFGAAACRFTRDSADWAAAEETIHILDSALSAFRAHSDTDSQRFKVAVALHLQPTAKKFVDIIRPVVPPAIEALEGEPIRSMAVVLQWPNRRVTIDGSAQISDGIFIRYERDFPGETEYKVMATQLLADQEQIFEMLDIREG